ncbi:MAG: SDR family oxidoreductase [Anaerolineae bacterium]|nr:SDR family oxidoreductase [Anaerolineae bacterium]
MTIINGVFVVTGATGNLGQVVARAFYRAGAKLALVDRTGAERFAETFPEMVGQEACYFAHSTDLLDEQAVDQLVSAVLAHFGQIDGAINIVGGYQAGDPVHETELETLEFMFNLNARTVFLVSRAVLPHMIARGQGKIVSIGARVALQGGKNSGAYSVGKTAVVRLTESMAAEVKAHGINVNAVLPGTIDTPQNREAMPDADFDRWVKPEALADVILFLASDAARAVHGAAVPVYGLS